MKKSNKILVELRNESLEDYLREMDSNQLNQLYENVLELMGEKKKKNVSKEEMVEYVFSDILSNVVASSIMLTDVENKQLNDIMSGKEVSNISEKLIMGNFIFKDKVNGKVCYYMFDEIKELLEEDILNSGICDNKLHLIVSFYLRTNGVLDIDKLLGLIKETGFDIKINELEDIIKLNKYIYEDNRVYNSKFAYDVSKSTDLISIKKENKYKVFSMEEIIGSMAMISAIVEKICNMLKSKIKDKKKLNEIITNICDIIASNSEYEDQVIQYLDDNKIKLSDKQYDKLFEEMLNVYMVIPSWELNGYTFFEMNHHDCDCGCDDYDWDIDDDLGDFDDLTKEEKLEVLVNAYMLINGAMRIKELMEILDLHHGLKTKKSEIINIVKILDDVVVNGEYLNIDGLGMEEIEMLMSQKDEFGQYKVIDDIDLFFDEYDFVLDELEELFFEYDFNEDVSIQIRSVLNMIGVLPEEVFDAILNDANIKINNKKKLAFIKDIKKISSRLMVWFLNGYSVNEVREMNNNRGDKVGRNEMCPCGSGKKYKQCCGK